MNLTAFMDISFQKRLKLLFSNLSVFVIGFKKNLSMTLMEESESYCYIQKLRYHEKISKDFIWWNK